MSNLLFIRHGESEGNLAGRFGGHGPTPLSSQGHAQAKRTAEALLKEEVAAVYSSDLIRAVETARPIAEAVKQSLHTSDKLRERSVGVLTGLTFAEAEAQYPDHYAAMMRRDPHACPPQGETAQACSERAISLLDELIARHDSGTIVMVSHAFTLSLMLRRLLHVDSPVLFHTDNCGIHRLRRRSDGSYTVLMLNDCRHLA